MENGQGEANNDGRRYADAAERTMVLPPVGSAGRVAGLQPDAPGPVARAEEMGACSVQSTPSAGAPLLTDGDIVDTQWGIKPLEFPPSVYDDGQPGASNPASAPLVMDMPEINVVDDASDSTDIRSGIAADLAAKPENQSKKRSPWLIVAIVAVAVVIVALTAGGLVYWNSLKNDGAHAAALAACNASTTSANEAGDKLSQALDGTKKAQAVTASQVADAGTVETLKSAIESGRNMGKASQCVYAAPTAQLNGAAKKNATLTSSMKKQASAITAAAKAVTESQTRKTVDDAKKKLGSELSAARALLAQSAGAVTDDATRTALDGSIKSAEGAMNKREVTADELAKALTALQDAEKSVQSSMQEYQARQKAATRQNSGSNNNYGYGYGYQNSQSGSSGTGTGSGNGNSSGTDASGTDSDSSDTGDNGNGDTGDNTGTTPTPTPGTGNGGGTTPTPTPGTGDDGGQTTPTPGTGDNGGTTPTPTPGTGNSGSDGGNTGGDAGNNADSWWNE